MQVSSFDNKKFEINNETYQIKQTICNTSLMKYYPASNVSAEKQREKFDKSICRYDIQRQSFHSATLMHYCFLFRRFKSPPGEELLK